MFLLESGEFSFYFKQVTISVILIIGSPPRSEVDVIEAFGYMISSESSKHSFLAIYFSSNLLVDGDPNVKEGFLIA